MADLVIDHNVRRPLYCAIGILLIAGNGNAADD